jgi:long-chain acyl-CoA synthetase
VGRRSEVGCSIEPGNRDIIAFAREHIAHYKCPRTIDFANSLPRLPTGKIQRRLVRDPYWADRDKSI